MGPAHDDQCNAPTKVEYVYKSSNPVVADRGFQPYEPDNPPSDVATTTTDQGKEVPYIVRVETGTVNRAIYKIALLSDPDEPFTPWAPQPGWNRKLFYPFGGGSSPGHVQRQPIDIPAACGHLFPTCDPALSRGWAVATASLNTQGNNTNYMTSAESTMMVQERLIEQFGEIRYTAGTGCSGGAVMVHSVANAYPGLLDGIIPQCSFPDSVSATNGKILPCSLLDRYYNDTSPHLWAVERQRAAVNGHATVSICAVFTELGIDQVFLDPSLGCTAGISSTHVLREAGLQDDEADWVYDAGANPTGTRCTIQDHMGALFGPRPPESWGEAEQQIGSGFTNAPWDNVGVQYGLRALESGLITTEQFVDLNEKVGGYDIDMNWQPQRSQADPFALRAAYRSGAVVSGEQLANVPIIDLALLTGNFEGHNPFYAWQMRDRLDAAIGHHDNHIIWGGSTYLVPAVTKLNLEAFILMDEWLEAIEVDGSAKSLETKVRDNRPARAVDACWIADRRKVTDMGLCRQAFPHFGDPAVAAGGRFRGMC